MNKTLSFFILLVLLFFFQSCKEEKIATIYNKCYAENGTVNEKSIKYYIKGFEKELIESNLLKDSTGESYNEFFFEMDNFDYIHLKTNYSFQDSIKGVEFEEALSCVKKISLHNDFDNSLFGKLAKYMKKNNGNHEGFFESQPVDSIFNPKTFEYDFIKHRLFLGIQVYDKNKNHEGKVLCKIENCPKTKYPF